MSVTVQKYGGSSVATVERIRQVAARIAGTRRDGAPTVVVVSARGDTTDDLLGLADQVSGVRPTRELDQLLATGEVGSAALLALALHDLGVPAVSLTGGQAGIVATGPHGAGLVAAVRTARIQRELATGAVVVVAGFQGVDADGDVVTLGRGGSDTTAVALAVALGQPQCEICTDVDGICTADPRLVPGARVLSTVDADAMAELAFAGAAVLHPRAVTLADRYGVQVRVTNAHAAGPGTVVVPVDRDRGGRPADPVERPGEVLAVAHDLDTALLQASAAPGAPDPTGDLLGGLAELGIPVDLLSRTVADDGVRIGCVVRRSDLDRVEKLVASSRTGRLSGMTGADRGVRVRDGVGKVSLVGSGLLDRPDVAGRLVRALAANGIEPIWIGCSQRRIGVVVRLDRTRPAVTVVHQEFDLAR
jgi:aspartate kinase